MFNAKLWSSEDEWKLYANCGESVDHTLPPTRDAADEKGLPVADVREVKRICAACRVRPECTMWALRPQRVGTRRGEPVMLPPPTGVWVASEYVPTDRRGAARVRGKFMDRLEREFAARGDDV